jgi:hypothetical protein|uniref:Uncharacterized protein n=1 Tax=Rhodopseudomonas palustris (strain BisA53) TaxID=316055 RepID=Q07LP3_RHOP5
MPQDSGTLSREWYKLNPNGKHPTFAEHVFDRLQHDRTDEVWSGFEFLGLWCREPIDLDRHRIRKDVSSCESSFEINSVKF